MRLRLPRAAGPVFLLVLAIVLAGCRTERPQARVNLPSPWATIQAADERAAAAGDYDSSLRP
jgi:hypothetical protein